MKKLILLLLIVNMHYAFGQKRSARYLLRWNLKDTVRYKTALGEVNIHDVKVDGKPVDSNDPLVQSELEKIKKEIGFNLGDYKLTTVVYPSKGNFDITLFFDTHPIIKGSVDNTGKLLTHVEKKSENFFTFFFALPEKSIRVGDEWKSNIQFQKNFKGISITDSTRVDRVVFENISTENAKIIATIKYELFEGYVGTFKDESGKEGKATAQFFYNAVGYFNITEGKWKSIDGIFVFDFDILGKQRSALKAGLIEE